MADRTKSAFIEELKAMKERMEELFLSNFQTDKGEEAEQTRAGGWLPLADLVDTGKELVYILDLPGVRSEDLQVECRGDRLWVSGTRLEALPEGEAIHIERAFGVFSRVFKLPCLIVEEGIEAEFRKGVLRITVPKECSSTGRTQRIFVRGEK